MPKTAKTAKTETPEVSKVDAKTFVANMAKTGTARNGRRIEFHFVRRKRKAY